MSDLARIAEIDAAIAQLDAAYRSRSATWALAKVQAGLDPPPEEAAWFSENRSRRAALHREREALAPGRPAPPPPPAPNEPASLRRRFSELRTGALFEWFGLEESGRTPGSRGTATLALRPAQGPYRAVACIFVTLGGNETLLSAQLALSRSFVDSAADGAFARDLLQSFLDEVIDAPDDPALERLARTIPFAGLKTPVIRRADAPIPPPAEPSDEIDVLLGRRTSAELTIADCEVAFVNTHHGREDVLVASIRPRAAQAGASGGDAPPLPAVSSG